MSRTPEARRRYRQKNRERILAYQSAWQKENREKTRLYHRRWNKKNPESLKIYARRANAKRPGNTQQRRLRWQDAEAGRRRPDRCEVCGDTGKISFDHCHERGIFRGWLCHNCNVIIGFARDNPDVLLKLAAYLKRTEKLVSPQLALPGI